MVNTGGRGRAITFHADILRRFLSAAAFAVGMALTCVAAVGADDDAALPNPAAGYRWQKAAAAAGLNDDHVARLERDGLVITGDAFRQVFSAYIGDPRPDRAGLPPLFITSDSLLNAFHVLYAESLARVERAQASKLGEALRPIWTDLQAADQPFAADDGLTLTARTRAQVLIGTALALLGDASLEASKPDARVAALIDAEVRRVIEATANRKPDWLGPPDPNFPSIDYARFKPRGFYDRDEALRGYFRAVAWLQAVPLRPERDDDLLALVLICRRLRGDDRGGPETELHRFAAVYGELLGPPDGVDAASAGQAMSGSVPLTLGPAQFAALRDAIKAKRADARRHSAVNDLIREYGGNDHDPTAVDTSVRVLPARWTPDAALFQRTADARTTGRAFPAGLEVCVALGSSHAAALLESKDRDAIPVVEQERHAFLDPAGAFPARPLYQDYLHALAALLAEPERDAPALFGSPAWRTKSCQTALGGWAQMRHAWTLQAKQTVMLWGGTRQPAGFVEPVPEFYARMRDVAERTRGVLDDAGALGFDAAGAASRLRGLAELVERKEFGRRGADAVRALTAADRDALAPLWPPSSRDDGADDADPAEAAAALAAYAPRLRRAADALAQGREPADVAPRLYRDDAQDLRPLWDQFERLCARLETLAHKQLRGAPFNGRDDAFIRDYGEALSEVMFYRGQAHLFPADDAPRVVDVFVNPVERKVLEVGVGRPRAMFILYPHNGGQVLCRGAVMPYHEFTSPERLTDEQWRDRLDASPKPEPAKWARPLYAGPTSRPAED